MEQEGQVCMMLPKATPSWRCNVVMLALACIGNATILFIADDPNPLTRASGMLSMAAATALVVSLRFEIRRFTLAVAAISMWLQSMEVIAAPIEPWSKIRLGLIFFALGFLAFGSWVHSMSGRWPAMNKMWCLPLI